MDFRDYPTNKSPRKELQGPRPTPLKVQKESHKIKKPPVPPLQGPPRPPVIIYAVSPKVIHANPSEFMNLVQRLTGSTSSFSSTSSTATTSSNFHYNPSALSPAARFASIENTRSPEGKIKMPNVSEKDVSIVEGVEIRTEIERSSGLFHGILSPNPASLPPISSNFFSTPSDPKKSNFFSTPSDPNSLGFFYDISPDLHSNKNYLDTSFVFPSPSTFISPRIASPSAQSIDLFNHLFDL